jgi:hypothetical protein
MVNLLVDRLEGELCAGFGALQHEPKYTQEALEIKHFVALHHSLVGAP